MRSCKIKAKWRKWSFFIHAVIYGSVSVWLTVFWYAKRHRFCGWLLTFRRNLSVPSWGVCLNLADGLNYTSAEALKIILIWWRKMLIFKIKDAHLMSDVSLEFLVSTALEFKWRRKWSCKILKFSYFQSPEMYVRPSDSYVNTVTFQKFCLYLWNYLCI